MEDEQVQDRLAYLEQGFAELAHHYSRLHNFLIQQFGDAFRDYVMAEEEQVNGEGEGEGEGGGEQEESSLDNSLEGGYEEGQQEQELELGEEGQESTTEEDEGTSATDMLNVEVSPGDEEEEYVDYEEQAQQVFQNRTHSSKVQHKTNGAGGRGHVRPMFPKGPSQQQQDSRTMPSLLRRPGASLARNVNMNGTGRLGQTTVSLVRPNPTSTAGNNRGNEVLLSNDDEDFKAGKYAKFYMKVNDELIQCKMCHKILKRRGKFIQHLRTHTGEKPFKCDYCPAAFSRKDNMNVHVAKHHPSPAGAMVSKYRPQPPPTESGLQNFQCDYCSKTFGNHRVYQSHLRLAHGVEFESGDGDTGEEEDMEAYQQYDLSQYLGGDADQDDETEDYSQEYYDEEMYPVAEEGS